MCILENFFVGCIQWYSTKGFQSSQALASLCPTMARHIVFNCIPRGDVIVHLQPHDWHIIASKLGIGSTPGNKMKCTLNLSQLKRNSRTRLEKKSDRKLPRPNDKAVEVIAVPDSQTPLSDLTSSVSLRKRPKVTGIKTADEDLNLQCTDAVDWTTEGDMVKRLKKRVFHY